MRIFNVKVNGVSYEVSIEEVGSQTFVPSAPLRHTAPVAPVTPVAKIEPVSIPAPVVATSGETISSPMPGNILDVKVSPGQSVKQGDILLILEAMKMENEIVAPVDGKVAQISVSKGQSVNTGDLLIVIA